MVRLFSEVIGDWLSCRGREGEPGLPGGCPHGVFWFPQLRRISIAPRMIRAPIEKVLVQPYYFDLGRTTNPNSQSSANARISEQRPDNFHDPGT